MTVDNIQILQLVSDIAEEEGIKVCLKESIKGGVITGTTTTLGGLLLGPIGLAIGGIVGGLTSYATCGDKFESIPSVMLKMDNSNKQLLADKCRIIINQIDGTDIIKIGLMLQSNPKIKEILMKELVNFLQSQMRLRVTY